MIVTPYRDCESFSNNRKSDTLITPRIEEQREGEKRRKAGDSLCSETKLRRMV